MFSTDLFSPAELWGVDCDEQPFDTAFLSVLNDSSCDLPVFVHISGMSVRMQGAEECRTGVQLEELNLLRFRCIHKLVERA